MTISTMAVCNACISIVRMANPMTLPDGWTTELGADDLFRHYCPDCANRETQR